MVSIFTIAILYIAQRPRERSKQANLFDVVAWKYDFTKQPHPFIQYLNDDKLNIKGTILTTNNRTTPNTLQFHLNIDKYKVIIWSSILYMSWSYYKILIGKCVLKSTG